MIDKDVEIFTKNKKVKNPATQKPSISIFVGGTGSGKTTYMMNFLKKLSDDNDFQRALFISPNHVDESYNALSDDIERISDPDDIRKFIDEREQMSEKELKASPAIMIFDDVQGSKLYDLKNNPKLQSFILRHRHYKTFIVICLQSWKNSISTVLKKQASLLFLFPPRNSAELASLIAELPVNKQKLIRAFEIVSTDPYTPLYINLQSSPLLFKGFKQPITEF